MLVRDYILLFKRLSFAAFFYVLSRVIFYFYNLNYFKNFSFGETLYAFTYGFRFDVATVFITNLFFILFSLIPYRNEIYERFLKTIFFIFNALFLGFIIVDFEFFIFLGRKMTFDIFDMAMDIQGQIFQLIYYYWFLALLVIVVIIVLWRYYPKIENKGQKEVKWWQNILVSFFILLMTLIGIRGGTQLRSIEPKNAFVHDHFELGNLSINAAYTMARSLGEKATAKENYFERDEQAAKVITQSRSFLFSGDAIAKKANVVIIIMESLSQEYVNEGYTPNFSKLAKQGLYFDKNFTNGKRSIEALPSILTGFPSLIGRPLYQTQFQSNRYYALPAILKEHGYDTAFFHGGKKGTMDFDSYCYSIGFDRYYSMDDYPKGEHYDQNWGIYDHYYFKFFANELDKMKTPFLAGIFTLSSHQPYSIPAEFQNKFSKGTLEIHESMGYADEALAIFMERAKQSAWFKNTLFVITADHTSKLESETFSNLLGRYRAPLLFYHPTIDLKQYYSNRVTQQADILPSVLEFVGINSSKRLLFGTSVFGADHGRMINYNSGQYFFIKDDFFLRFDRTESKLFRLNDDKFIIEESQNQEALGQMLNELKAYIQYTNNGLRSNNIYEM